jgi:hypothetical protein
MTEHDRNTGGPDPLENDPTEHDPVESARPSLGRRDEPDTIRPDTDDRPHRTLPPEPEETGDADQEAPDAPRPTESPAGPD